MKRMILLTFDPSADVYYPLVELLGKEDVSEVLIPVITRGIFTETAINAVKEQGVEFKIYLDVETTMDGLEEDAEQITICSNPIKELLNLVTPDDILAMAWDDSDEAHMTIHALEDFGLEMWNIKGTLNPIEMDYSEDTTEELHDAMQESLASFIEIFSAYIASSVLDTLMDTITERLEQELGTKDINPFKDDDTL
jgi:hypothetical protein